MDERDQPDTCDGPTEAAFAGPAALDALHKPCSATAYQAVFAELLAATDVDATVAATLNDFLSTNRLFLHLLLAQYDSARLAPLRHSSGQATHLRRFLASRAVLRQTTQSTWVPTGPYPPEFDVIAQTAARSLYRYAGPQFATLRACMYDFAEALHSSYAAVTLLHLPIGNTIPTQLFQFYASRVGLQVRLVTLNMPRNDRIWRGRTLKQTVESNQEVIIADKHPVVVIDEVMTGSRFSKILEALGKAVGADVDLVAYALAFPEATSGRRGTQKQRDGLRRKIESLSPASRWSEFPPIPSVTGPDGASYTYKGKVSWAGDDLVAGCRKVNLVFELLHQFRVILDDLGDNESRFRGILEQTWSVDSAGRRFEFREGLIQECVRRALSSLDWDVLTTEAAKAFPSDYIGDVTNLEPTDVQRRLEWTMHALARHSNWAIAKAIMTVFSVMGPEYAPPDRDRAYCEYLLEIDPRARSLNDELVRVITTDPVYPPNQ